MDTWNDRTASVPSGRRPPEEIRRQHEVVAAHLDTGLLDTMPLSALILNAQRQIVQANSAALRMLGGLALPDILGVRPGDLLHCTHRDEGPGGCGTSEACRQCGAAWVIRDATAGVSSHMEARILAQGPDGIQGLNLRGYAAPLPLGGEDFSVVYLRDVSSEKDKEILERAFYHDAVNALSGVSGALDLLPDVGADDLRELAAAAKERVTCLIRDIQAQRLLKDAESRSLSLDPCRLDARDLCRELLELHSRSELARGIRLTLDPGPKPLPLVTDKVILARILENLLKNALEASLPGQEVVLGCAPDQDRVVFFVRNEAVMSANVQVQVFQRAFSTKGAGRGLGAYGARMLAENFLRGEVRFHSEPGAGTTFWVTLPSLSAAA